jgi:isoleucyl-tRNA synthetase
MEGFYFRRNMKFNANTRRRALEYEKDLVNYWKENKTFEKSIEQRPIENSYVFYDGPPFITGVPHHGTLLSSIVKDAVPRYQTMKGRRVERVWGWDCHGLPAENFTEKKLNITSRHDIGTKISLEEYIMAARDNMVQTGDLWESTIDRIGRWVDFKGAYKTMDKDYMESVWWAFKQLYDKGKIYEGEKVLMYDTQWATPLSKAEVTMDAGAYVEVTDPSVYVKFKLKNKDEFYEKVARPSDDPWVATSDRMEQELVELRKDRGPAARKAQESGDDVYLLAWTTTPWTLAANAGLAIWDLLSYTEVKVGSDRFIVANDLVDKIFIDEKHQLIDYEVTIPIFSGHALVGLEYEPLFGAVEGENSHKVWNGEYVSAETGTGVVHLAPAYGEEDFELAKQEGIPVVHVLDEYGVYTEGPWKGLEVWENNKRIAKELKEQGKVWKIDYIRHEYPHNPRTGHRLMYRAHPSWFMDIDGQRSEMLAQNAEHINWFPAHIKHGRFEKTMEQAPDWNLSRDRFWATAMPVWKGDKGTIKVVGSYAELKELSGVELEDYHRPWIDEVTFDIEGEHFTRIDKVIDGWFESGSMPFAQFHYPFENVEKFEANFPGDFIVEYVGQVRAWFYYMHAVSVALFGHNAFKNVIVTGNLMGEDGYKLSKSRGNFTDPNELMDQYSADSLRLLILSSPVLNGEDFAVRDKDVGDAARKLSMIWNMYDFFTMYADVDGWEFDGNLQDPSADLNNPLDLWVVSRVHQLIEEVEASMDGYDVAGAMKPILPFVDDASNWFVRRSRRRFWKSEDDADKNNAYRTLHYVLVRLSQVIAPFTPFLAEELYRNLTGEESVHLTDWPKTGEINVPVVTDMETVREYVNQALSLRAAAKLKIRQPLASVTVPTLGNAVDFKEILTEELNVKEVLVGEEVTIDTELTDDLKREGLMREVIRHIQAARKEAGLNVDDRITLGLSTEDETLAAAIAEHQATIQAETLANTLTDSTEYEYSTSVSVEGAALNVSLQKD